MKKALVVTINRIDNENYGNALQNVASLMVLRSLDVQADTFSLQSARRYERRYLFKYPFHTMTFCAFTKNKHFWQVEAKRKINFLRFKKKYMANVCYKEVTDDDKYDYYVVGSDQVWNASWFNAISEETFLLKFCSDEKKVTMVPSFGIEALPDKWKPVFAEWLPKFKYLSVREEAGARIIKKLTGRDAEVLIDPTLAISAEEWQRYEKRPKGVDFSKPYILTYFLGDRTARVEQDVIRLSTEKGYQVYNLLDQSQPKVYAAGPSEFLYLISHAALVLTDSFHACVFSFLYQKPFLVYSREGKENNMMSRIETLLSKFHLERKFADSGLTNDVFECSYENSFAKLQAEREKLFSFLRKAMELD